MDRNEVEFVCGVRNELRAILGYIRGEKLAINTNPQTIYCFN